MLDSGDGAVGAQFGNQIMMKSKLAAIFALALGLGLATALPVVLVPSEVAAQSLIDINSATKQELMTLPGIGDARADAIIKGRPYKGKDELTQRGIIPDGVYAQIKDKIIAKQK